MRGIFSLINGKKTRIRPIKMLIRLSRLVQTLAKGKKKRTQLIRMPNWLSKLAQTKLGLVIKIHGVLFTLATLTWAWVDQSVSIAMLVIVAVVSWLAFVNWFKGRWFLVGPHLKLDGDVDSMSGEDFEIYVAKLFALDGYRCTLTPRTGDFGLDVIAYGKDEILGLQCKRYASAVGVTAIQEAVTGCLHYGCDYPIVVTTADFTRQAYQLASSTQCKLIGRNELLQLMRNHLT